MDAAKVKVRDAERWLLSRWWWVFPSVAVLLAMLTGGGFWAWVEGGRPWLDWRQAFTLRSVAFVVAGLAVVVGWRLFLNRKWPGWAVWMLAASGFACVELAVRNPAAQTAFWLAAENRIPAKANMSFMTYLNDYEAPFLFLNASGTNDDILSFAHEFGDGLPDSRKNLLRMAVTGGTEGGHHAVCAEQL